jgi:hypothetical protein
MLSNGRVRPIAASGYIWIPLEQDKDRIVSKYTRGRIHSKLAPLIMNLRLIPRALEIMTTVPLNS